MKLAQDARYGKKFLADIDYILRSSCWLFKSRGHAYAKASKLKQSNEVMLILKRAYKEFFDLCQLSKKWDLIDIYLRTQNNVWIAYIQNARLRYDTTTWNVGIAVLD